MESLGNGKWGAEDARHGSSTSKYRRRRRWTDRWFRASAIGMLCLLLLASSVVRAQTSGYVYDANGRVVAVTATNGTTVPYGYNTLGHINQVGAPLSPGQLAIFAFAPTHGVAGAQVTINGNGFGNTAANNAVSFNGTTATVLSASTTQLVVTVPSGATTGPISVTVGGQTVASATSFVIDDTGVAPAITQVSPLIVAAGSTVTVTGTHLDPVPGDTAVQMGDMNAPSLSSVADTQLQYAAITSGYVTVETPYGQATSASPVIVPPSGVAAANVVSSGYATSGGVPVALNIGAAGQVGAVLFQANADTWLSLQATGITSTANNINYKIYAPGNVLIQQGAVSATSPSIHLPNLTASGTYLAIFQPDTAGAQLSIALETDAALVTSSSLSVATNTTSRSERLTFTAAASANVEMTLANLAVVGGSSNGVQVEAYNAEGSNVGGFDCYSSNPGGAGRLPLWNLAAGTYTVVVTPLGGGTMSFNALLQPDTIGPTLTANVPVNINLGVGQVERLTFNANAGDTVALQLSGVNTTPAGQLMYVQVYSPGTTPPTVSASAYSIFSTTSSTTVNLQNLPASGTYLVVVSIISGTAGGAQLTLASSVGGTIADNGNAQSYQANVSGQNVYLTFQANQGDNLELTISGLAITGSSSTSAEVNVYSSSGTNVYGLSCYTTSPGGSCRLPLWNLAAGTYSVVVSPPDVTSRISFNAILAPDMLGPVLAVNTPTTINLAAGQSERLTFNANAGDTVALQLSGVSTAPAGQQMYVQVYSPGTTPPSALTSAYSVFSTASSTMVNLQNLPASGTYLVVVSLASGTPGNAQLTLAPSVGGTIVDNDIEQSYQTNMDGQNAYLTFSANQGDNLELTINGIAINGSSSTSAAVNVYSSNGTNVYSLSCPATNPGGSCRLPLWNLAAGTYSVVISPPDNNSRISFNAILAPDIAGPVLAVNTPTTINLAAGQSERLTFNANAGDTAVLQLSGVSTTPAGQQMYVQVYSPGTTPPSASTSWYSIFSTTSSTTANLQNLPTSGTYLVVVSLVSGTPASAQLALNSQ
ncbi:IPT/TIG domain protein [Burkholderia pseudomallei]|nr:IPT/TIG domain protein [Burkholderia pseudomallei]